MKRRSVEMVLIGNSLEESDGVVAALLTILDAENNYGTDNTLRQDGGRLHVGVTADRKKKKRVKALITRLIYTCYVPKEYAMDLSMPYAEFSCQLS